MIKIKWFFSNLFKGLFNDKEGFSMRKCIGIVVAKISLLLEIALTSEANLVTVLMINFGFISLLFGIVTAQNLIELKGK